MKIWNKLKADETYTLKNDDWYIINAAADSTTIEILDQIGGNAIDPKNLVAEINSIETGTITVILDSQGGSVFGGLAIMNALKQHPAKINVKIRSLAASIASVVMMAGDHIAMDRGAMIMIHNPWQVAAGDAKTLRKQADLLDKIGETLADIYAEKSGIHDSAQWLAWMEEDFWMTAREAYEYGLVDEIDEPEKTATKAETDATDDINGNIPIDEYWAVLKKRKHVE